MTKENGRWHEAHWLGPVPNRYKAGMLANKGLVLHIQEGYESGTDSAFHNPKFQASAHFGVAKDGHADQWVDLNDAAWAEMGGNRYWTSVENEGFSGQSLTDAQVETLAKLYAWGHRNYGWPLQIANEIDGQGLIYHGAGGADWGNHPNCPGVPIVAQRQRILDRCADLLNHVPPPDPQPKPPPKVKPPSWYHRELEVTKPMQHGTDVEKVQRIVGAHEDGWYGPNTEARVKGWQKAHHLAVDGIVGPATAKEIAA